MQDGMVVVHREKGLEQGGAGGAQGEGAAGVDAGSTAASVKMVAIRSWDEMAAAPLAACDQIHPSPINGGLPCYHPALTSHTSTPAPPPPPPPHLQVSVCPLNVLTGFTLFVEDEDKNVNAILTRSELEGRMVVHLAGRCAEKLVMGEGQMTGA